MRSGFLLLKFFIFFFYLAWWIFDKIAVCFEIFKMCIKSKFETSKSNLKKTFFFSHFYTKYSLCLLPCFHVNQADQKHTHKQTERETESEIGRRSVDRRVPAALHEISIKQSGQVAPRGRLSTFSFIYFLLRFIWNVSHFLFAAAA